MNSPWWINQSDEELVLLLDRSYNEKGKIAPKDYFDGLAKMFFYITGGLVVLGSLLGWALYATFETGLVFLFLIPFIIPLLFFIILSYGFIASYFEALKSEEENVALLKKELDRRRIFY